MGLTERIARGPDRRQAPRFEPDRREVFVAPWRRRQLEQAEVLDVQPGGRFVAVNDLTERGAA